MRLAIVGDVHELWDAEDAPLLDAEGYDAVLFVGDLAGYTVRGGLATARRIAALRTPAYCLPGNHDAVHALQLGAEIFPRWAPLRRVLGRRMPGRVEALREALGPVRLTGYALHDLGAFTLLAARPHSCGGPRLAYARYLRRAFGVEDMAGSAAKLRALVDRAPAERPLVVLAHDGPTGLGAERDAPCGRDFHPDGGDWGAPDLRAALDHAAATGKRVAAVCFGHMHHGLRGQGGDRRWQAREGPTLFVNAARVPRHGRRGRHHVALELEGGAARVEPRWLGPPVAR